MSRSQSWCKWGLKQVRNLFIGLVIAVALLWWFENRFVYYPTTAAQGWAEAPGFTKEDVALALADGTPIHAWWCPTPDAVGTILYCHGNGGNLSDRVPIYRQLQKEHRVSILAVGYPGYGRCGGKPTEAGCCNAAELAFDWLTTSAGVRPESVLLLGESLGGGVVVELATRRPCWGLILFSTFTSLPDLGQEKLPWLPIRPLMTNRYDNLSKIKAIDRPVFVAHGDADDLIPIDHAHRLFEAAAGPKALHIDSGRGHELVFTTRFHEALRQFLARHVPAK